MTSKNTLLDFFRTLSGSHIVFMAFIAVSGYFLWAEHEAHILAALPYLILLICPLMHIFMHGNHGGHGKGDKTDTHENH